MGDRGPGTLVFWQFSSAPCARSPHAGDTLTLRSPRPRPGRAICLNDSLSLIPALRMARIQKPSADFGEANTVADLLNHIGTWTSKHVSSGSGYHQRVWFRGHSKRIYELEPGVYRDGFTARAKSMYGRDLEEKRLNLEREMLGEFRTAGATFTDPSNVISLYFIAQHFGMPTRLLDWTTNPLAALFFAVIDDENEDGDVFMMDPVQVVEKPKIKGEPIQIVRTMRHPLVADAIGMSFWHSPKELAEKDPKEKEAKPVVVKYPRIFAVRPDNEVGRIGQQSSCFTLHTHCSSPVSNASLARIKVPAKGKARIRQELHLLNINHFTIFNDLDHLSKEVICGWGLSH